MVPLGFVKDGSESGVVLAGKKMSVDAAWIDSSEGALSFRSNGEGAGGRDFVGEAGAVFEPLVVVFLLAKVGVKGGILDHPFFFKQALLILAIELLPSL